jgi:hypothetical protein
MAASFLQDSTTRSVRLYRGPRKQPQLHDDSLICTPEANADEFDSGEVIGRVFVISRGDAPELLDPVEEALDQIALAVEPRRETEALLAIGAVGNVGPNTPGRCRFTDGVAVITLVAQQGGASGMVSISASASQASWTCPPVSLRPTGRP